MLTEKDIQDYKEAKGAADKAAGKINKRIEEVVRLIFKACGKKYSQFWWYPNASEGQAGSIGPEELSSDYISLEFDDWGKLSSFDTYCFDYRQGVPTQFLFMDDEAIIAQIKEEIEETEKRKKKRKETTLARKAEKAVLAKAAKEKLTKEERKALGL